jgi:hypothetical protein
MFIVQVTHIIKILPYLLQYQHWRSIMQSRNGGDTWNCFCFADTILGHFCKNFYPHSRPFSKVLTFALSQVLELPKVIYFPFLPLVFFLQLVCSAASTTKLFASVIFLWCDMLMCLNLMSISVLACYVCVSHLNSNWGSVC